MTRNLSLDIIQRYLEPRDFLFEDFRLGAPSRLYTRITSPTAMTMVTPRYKLTPPFMTSAAQSLFKNKSCAYDLVNQLGVNTPTTLMVARNSNVRPELIDFLRSHDTVIVKPHDSSGSRGLTLDITAIDQLEAAIDVASKVSASILVQKQFFGQEIRFLLVNGKVRSALMRRKASITGDGVLSIAQLIELENQSRAKLTDTLVIYPQLTNALVDAELLNSNFVPAENENIELNKSTMIRDGASVTDVLTTTHLSYQKIIESIAGQFGTGYLAVDLMVHDRSVKAAGDNYVFLEVNISPALSMFYSCRDGKHVKIVEEYIGPLFESALTRPTIL